MKTKNLLFGLITLNVFLFSCTTSPQESKVYVTKLDYFPSKRDNVTDEEYRKGKHSLEQTYYGIRNDRLEITYADHLNIAHAFAILKEPKEKILSELELAQKKNLESTAAVFTMVVTSPDAYNLTQSEYDSLKSKFRIIHEKAQMEKVEVDISNYAKNNNLDRDLVELIVHIEKEDQKYRTGNENWDMQNKIDKANMSRIDSIYSEYNTYVGRSFVGIEYEHVMWVVIQHGTLEDHERYLCVVQEAVKSNELREGPLKMLVDRIYAKKHGYQIFGSQGGVNLAPDEVIEKVKKEFGIE